MNHMTTPPDTPPNLRQRDDQQHHQHQQQSSSSNTNIEDFIVRFESILSSEDINQLRHIDQKINELRNKKLVINRNGQHYEDCEWSNDRAVANTHGCKCLFENVATEERKAQNLMNFYKFIYGVMSQ